jgi:hypothetical protein
MPVEQLYFGPWMNDDQVRSFENIVDHAVDPRDASPQKSSALI